MKKFFSFMFLLLVIGGSYMLLKDRLPILVQEFQEQGEFVDRVIESVATEGMLERLWFYLEGETGSLKAGPNCGTGNGISSGQCL